MKNQYPWMAIFSNGRVIRQYDEDGNEILFKNVLDMKDKLIRFNIASESDLYSIDLIAGLIKHNEEVIKKVDISKKAELVYFRRNVINMTAGEKIEKEVIHFIGLNDEVIEIIFKY